MEGVYFFGEHLRWNLGWENPNQGGAFISTLIPWMWALGRAIGSPSWKSHVLRTIFLAIELALWFLLCKTYSRGALVSCAGAGIFFALASTWVRRVRPGLPAPSTADRAFPVARLSGLAILLISTGFFARIDPRFVAGDASAGNRLTLWKGGLQMISISPWQGWGPGESGRNFAQWFQPLEAEEEYAGMVNSYLHLAVERGLPLLIISVAILAGFLLLALSSAATGKGGVRPLCMALGAAASLLSFLIANVFSTLWVFRGLWWVPGGAILCILVCHLVILRPRSLRSAAKPFAVSFAIAIASALALYAAGKKIPHDIKVLRNTAGDLIISRAAGAHPGPARIIVAIPEETVLGDHYGKEIRRLVLASSQPALVVHLPRLLDRWKPGDGRAPSRILAFGKRFAEGFAMWENFPEAGITLVHPAGRPRLPDSLPGEVEILLPSLDTSGSSRAWRAQRKTHPAWKFATSPGVGQDIRLAWPGTLLSLWAGS